MDFYALLGLAPSASEPEIERAYRRLVRRYHPGINPGDRVAEQMYQQIQEAYRVLADAERRRTYDRGGAAPTTASDAPIAFEGFDFSASTNDATAATFSELFADVFRHAAREATAPTRGADIVAQVSVTWRDAMRGGEIPLSVTRQDRCPACHGTGQVPRPSAVCQSCGGDGERRWARGHMVFTKPCADCGGAGRIASAACRPCRGVGLAPRTEVVRFAIPAGVESGARLAVPGHGHAGAFGGPAGDLYVTVDVGEHAAFRRAGRDLHLAVPVGIHEAALGATIEIPTLGDPVPVTIPDGSNGGTTIRLRGYGVGFPAADAGDLVLTLHLVLPPVLDARSQSLLREFGRANPIERSVTFD